MKRNILLGLCIISICITIFSFVITYARYSEEAKGEFESTVGKWNIKLNNVDITQSNVFNFLIEDIIVFGNNNVAPGKMAPGLLGYFDINIDAEDTDVSVKYDITINEDELENSEIKIVNVYELSDNELIKTNKSTYTGIMLLEDIQENKSNTIRIELEWSSEDETLQEDLDFANSVNNVLKLPITVNVIQYTGEEIIEYN